MPAAEETDVKKECKERRFKYDHRKYLSEAGLEATASSDESVGEGDDDGEEDIDDEGQSFIGISIGRQQTRLAAPSTPAAEKAAAIGDDPFAKALEQAEHEKPHEPSNLDGAPTGMSSEQPQDPPRSSGRTTSKPAEGSLSSALRSVMRSRSRSSSGSALQSHDRSQKKLLPINLPSLPRFSIPTAESTFGWLRMSNDDGKYPGEATISRDGRSSSQYHTAPKSPHHSATAPEARSGAAGNDPHYARPPLLRRSTSDGSLFLHRSLSRASSLGDDTRWEGVHGQVNSRMKAIKDTLADSNFRLPRFRPSIRDLSKAGRDGGADSISHVGTQTRDFGHARHASEGTMWPQRNLETSALPPSSAGGMTKTNAAAHPHFSRALRQLTGDVVILGGYRGSILRSSEPPNRQLWVPIKVGMGLRKVDLEVGLEPEDDENMKNKIFSSGMLTHIGPVEISRRLFKRLRGSKQAQAGRLRIWDYGYDWRLSPHLLSRQLQDFLKTLPCNKNSVDKSQRGALVVAHSLGGLITRHAINKVPELFSGVVYVGTPTTCVNILGPLRTGDEVFLSSKVLTAQVNFTIRTSYALLPLDGKCFIDKDTKEEYPVDFFDPQTWEEYRLSPCIARSLPPLSMPSEPPGVVSQIVDSMTSVFENVTSTKYGASKRTSTSSSPRKTGSSSFSDLVESEKNAAHDPVEPHIGQDNPQQHGQSEEMSVSTAVTIPKEAAVKYLTRTLAEVKNFKQELAYNPDLESRYPPTAVIYGKSTPTVYGAAVKGREGIKHADAYDNLLFASGDGVVLARAAQMPEGYHVVKGGVVSSDRGHISLLGDLEAVGRCFNAIISEKRRRVKKKMANEGGEAKV